METHDKTEEVRILKCIDRDVHTLVNLWGEETYVEYYTGSSKYLYEMHLPDLYLTEDEEGDIPEPDPMQYYIIDQWLAEKMIQDRDRRDPVMETNDGLHIWVRCGCGYGLYDDLAKYYMS
tara:strand:- start:7347 stop:7706 length:360 start_codon:yes stop_codon:yes gene_type:complete